jgi:hypothetical protein
MSIFFLVSGQLVYLNAVYDPWFRTGPEIESSRRGDPASELTYYRPAQPVSILGCRAEQQLCNPILSGTEQCVHFTPSTNRSTLYSSLRLNQEQAATSKRLLTAIANHDLENILWSLPQPLIASRTVAQSGQYALLPQEQWKRELKRWFSIELTSVQLSLVESVTGSAPYEIEVRPQGNESDVWNSCECQTVYRVPGVRNFNFTAIITVIVLGSVIIMVGLMIDTVVGRTQRSSENGTKKRAQWVLDSNFQQQRLAYEAAMVGGWTDTDTIIPTNSVRKFPLLGQIRATDAAFEPQNQLITKRRKEATEIDADHVSSDSTYRY